MANKFRGEAVIEYTTADEEGTEKPAKTKLIFDANALCEIEDVTGLSMGGFLQQLSDPKQMSFKTVRAFVWGGMVRDNPDATLTDAGDVISDAGLETVMEAMQKAVGGAFPKAKGGAKGEAKAKSGRGIGRKP